MFISSCGSTSPQQSSQWAMKGWFSSISSGGRSQKQMSLPPLLMNIIYSLQQGHVEWCLHQRTRQAMQKECPHSRLPNSSSGLERQMAHFSATLSVTSLSIFMRLAMRGFISPSVFLEDASTKRISLLFSVAHRLDWLRVNRQGITCCSLEFLLLIGYGTSVKKFIMLAQNSRQIQKSLSTKNTESFHSIPSKGFFSSSV